MKLLALKRVGMRQGELRLIWPDGRDWVHPFVWEVRPLVHAAPSALVLRADAASQEYRVFIKSEDRPIRVIGVDGSALASPVGPLDDDPKTTQSLRLTLDSTRLKASASDIVIKIDHPEQPEVVLSVLCMPKKVKE